MVSKEEENFLRIVYLNYSVATRALTRFFDKLHSNLSADLHNPRNKAKLEQLLNPPPGRKRVLYQGQWDILYPPTGTPKVTSADLDLTLIVCLLRNLPPVVVAPVNGFDELPNPNDKSDGANIARLKYYKNFLVSHSKDGSISNVDFVGMWNTLEQAIKGLDNSKASIASLKDAKTKMLDNSMAQLLSTQIQLETKVSNLQDDLEQISIYIDKDVKEKKKMKQLTTNLEEIIKLKGCNLERLFNKSEENKDMIDILYERLNSSEVKGLTTKSELLQNEWIKQEKDHIPNHIRVAPEDSGDKDTLKGRMSQIKINKDMTSERNMMDFFLENEEDLEDSTNPQRQQQCCNAPNIVQMDEHTEQCQNCGAQSMKPRFENQAEESERQGTRADEPVTKGWYAKNWQDLVVSMQGKINALEGKVSLITQQIDQSATWDSKMN
ncbi:unnamed protein product [Mytilus coruscus]|uniref:DZIP3-like HEPN domain-containing protein n=1 Tax=Mytilus coruscus TaxID=42192 RepID=A0A6J8AH42_MYTCO|nr:unnamed protein product [Mytilus coruscus]